MKALVQEKEVEVNQNQRKNSNSLRVLSRRKFHLNSHPSWLRIKKQT